MHRSQSSIRPETGFTLTRGNDKRNLNYFSEIASLRVSLPVVRLGNRVWIHGGFILAVVESATANELGESGCPLWRIRLLLLTRKWARVS